MLDDLEPDPLDGHIPDLLATTIAGSLPKPAWLAEPTSSKPWKLEGEALAQGKQDAVRLALFDQSTRASTSSPTASRRGAIS